VIEDIDIPLADGGSRPGVLAIPDEREGPVPAVVVIHDITGFKPDTRRHCRNFAEAGYAAIAPDLYGGGRVGCVVQTLLSIARDGGPANDVIATARRLLVDRPEVDGERVGITGFCMGGGFALLAAADDAYAVAAPFYGSVPKSKERLRGICPTLAQYGERDVAFRSHWGRLAEHLESLGVEHEILVHPGVGHSFMNDHDTASFALGRYTPLRAAYDAPTEAIAWEKMLAFFDAHMPGGA
jgi:carboxymethylenebutenolidase